MKVAHHGYIHENPLAQSRDEQLYWLQRGIEVIEKYTGQRPRGWRAPLYNFSNDSADLLIQEGFTYDASLMGDDIPYIIRTDSGQLVELPSHWGLDDWPPYVHSIDLDYVMPIRGPREAIQGFRSEFDCAWEYGGLWISVWHPFASGRLSRWAEAEKLIEYMLEKGDVWFATLEDIAAHVTKCIDDKSFEPRIDRLPFYDEPIEIKGFEKE